MLGAHSWSGQMRTCRHSGGCSATGQAALQAGGIQSGSTAGCASTLRSKVAPNCDTVQRCSMCRHQGAAALLTAACLPVLLGCP